jgi:hypothetical protein
MTLPELINYFREDGSTYEGFCKMQRLDADIESVEMYMPKPFGLNGKLEFFKVEETAGKSPYEYNGSEFYNMFDFYYFMNIIKDPRNENMADIDLALRLIDYAERDD